MSPRERYFSEKIARLGWRIPLLDPIKKSELAYWITKREHQKLDKLEEEVLQKLQNLATAQNAQEAPGFRGTIFGSSGILVGQDDKHYRYTVLTDIQRLEVIVVDVPRDKDGSIRKYREFLGKFGPPGEEFTVDLSCYGDKTFSWRRNSQDFDYLKAPEKGLTLKESYRFLEEILHANPILVQSSAMPLSEGPSTSSFDKLRTSLGMTTII